MIIVHCQSFTVWAMQQQEKSSLINYVLSQLLISLIKHVFCQKWAFSISVDHHNRNLQDYSTRALTN